MRRKTVVSAILAPLYLVTLLVIAGAASNQGLPPFPAIYSGDVFVAGELALDGVEIYARISDYRTDAVVTKNGRYSNLVVGPTDNTYLNQEITFHVESPIEVETAAETAIFLRFGTPHVETLNLHFNKMPPQPTPIPPFVGDETVARFPITGLGASLLVLAAGILLVRFSLQK